MIVEQRLSGRGHLANRRKKIFLILLKIEPRFLSCPSGIPVTSFTVYTIPVPKYISKCFRDGRLYSRRRKSRPILPTPKNTVLKWGRWFTRMYFSQEGRHTYEKFPKKGEETASGKLRRVFLSRKPVIYIITSIIQRYRWWYTTPWRWFEELRHLRLARQRSCLFLQKLVTASRRLCLIVAARVIFVSKRPWCLLRNKLHSELGNRRGPLLRIKLKFLSFLNFKGTETPKFENVVDCQILMVVDQQLEDIFNIVLTNFFAWLNIMCLAVNDASRGTTVLSVCNEHIIIND
jgi:hypothetical protein